MIRPIAALSILLVLMVLTLSTGNARADEPPFQDQAQLLRFFEDVTVGNKKAARLTKWQQAPLVRLETMVGGPKDASGRVVPIPVKTSFDQYSALAKIIAELRQLTGLPIRLLPRDIGSGGNIVVTVIPRLVMPSLDFVGVDQSLIRQLMGPSRCFFVAWPNRDWVLRKAKIVINSELEEDHIKHCFIEELTQTLGLPNDSERLSPSIFNEGAKLLAFSPVDKLMIRTLYDPRLPAGSALEDIRQTAGPVLKRNAQE